MILASPQQTISTLNELYYNLKSSNADLLYQIEQQNDTIWKLQCQIFALQYPEAWQRALNNPYLKELIDGQ